MADYRAKFASDTFTPDALLLADYPVVSKKVTIALGTVLKRGALMGKVTADGTFKLAASAAGDGSEVPDAILANDTIATDDTALVYTVAGVPSVALILGAGITLTPAIVDGLRVKGIHVLDSVKAQ